MSAATIPQEQLAYYRQSVDAVLAALGTDARLGLSQEEARARLERYGKNELMAEKPVPAWRKFLTQFHDVLVILLLIATVISAGLWVVERGSALPYEAIAIYELNAVLYNERLARELEQAFERALLHCTQFDVAEYRERNAALRFRDSVARLCSPLL